jgi:hypothetical protein
MSPYPFIDHDADTIKIGDRVETCHAVSRTGRIRPFPHR